MKERDKNNLWDCNSEMDGGGGRTDLVSNSSRLSHSLAVLALNFLLNSALPASSDPTGISEKVINEHRAGVEFNNVVVLVYECSHLYSVLVLQLDPIASILNSPSQ